MAKKIIVVDDDDGILEAVTMVLEMEGYKVLGLKSGSEVVDKAKEFLPHVILLDMLISGVDGREVCRELKHERLTRNIPVILVSAHPGIKTVAGNSKAEGYLAKPFETKELLRVVKSFEK